MSSYGNRRVTYRGEGYSKESRIPSSESGQSLLEPPKATAQGLRKEVNIFWQEGRELGRSAGSQPSDCGLCILTVVDG